MGYHPPYPSWKTTSFAVAATLVLLGVSLSAGAAVGQKQKQHPPLLSARDRVLNLPGQPQVSFQQFAGYIPVDDRKQRALFYYFAEADIEPTTKPLVLWLNGGPGCSSVGVGAFSENGPFRPSGTVLVRNEHSWNRVANMLYLESPAGVGFSFSVNDSFYSGVNDKMTAKDNLVFLQRWLNKFPRYKRSDFFITGESYAGHYVPQLAQLIVEYNKQHPGTFNLKGIAMGNPVLEFATDFNSRAEYMWTHGLISDATYDLFTRGCNYSRYVSEYYRGTLSPACSHTLAAVGRETSRYVDKYDVTLDVCVSSSSAAQSHRLLRLQQQAGERAVDVCLEDETVSYLNRKDVQAALHARLRGVPRWMVCSSVLDYALLDVEIPTISVVGSLVKAGVPVLVYSGDQDSVIPLTGSRTLVHRLAAELGLLTTVPYRVWFQGKQVGGWTQVYGNMLSFATIRGASHEAPFSQPERSLVLFSSFLQGKPLPETF